MNKKILTLSLLSLLALSSCGSPNPTPNPNPDTNIDTTPTVTKYNFDYVFDSTLGNVTSSVKKGEVEKGTSITLTASVNPNVTFKGFYNKKDDSLLSAEKVYTFKLESDLFVEAKFQKEFNHSDDTLSVLKGTFNSTLGELTVLNNKAIFKGETFNFDLPLNEVDSNDSTATGNVLYIGVNKEYKLFVTAGEFKHVELHTKLSDGTYEKKVELYPTIDEFSGSYYFNDGKPYDNRTLLFTIGNVFDNHRGIYIVNIGMHNENVNFDNQSGRYIVSGYVEVDNKLVKAVRLYDYVDKALSGTFVVAKKENTTYLNNLMKGEMDLMFTTSIFNTTYFTETGLVTFKLEGDKVVQGEEKYDVEALYGANGYEYTLKNATNTRKFKPSPFGIIEVIEGKDVIYPFDGSENRITGVFIGNGLKVEFTISNEGTKKETLKINDEVIEFKYVNKHDHKTIEANYKGDVYHIHGYKDDTSENSVIKVYKGEKVSFLVNKDIYGEIFKGKMIHKGLKNKLTLEIDQEFNLVYNGVKQAFNLQYDPKEDEIFIKFDVEGISYTYTLHDRFIGCFLLSSKDEDRYFFKEESLKPFNGVYTSHHEKELEFLADKVIYKGKTYNYTFEPIFEEATFANFVGAKFVDNSGMNLMFGVDFKNNIFKMEGYTSTNNVNVTDTFIKYEDFVSLVGRYALTTKYGEENFELTPEGRLTVDQLKPGTSGLQEGIAKRYTLGYDNLYGKNVPTIGFNHEGTIILLKKDGASLVTFGNYYVLDYIFKFNGHYKDETNALSLYQNKLSYNGKLYEYDKYEKVSETETKLTSGTNTFTFIKEGAVRKVVVNVNNNTTTLTETSFNPETLVGAKTGSGMFLYYVEAIVNESTGIKTIVLTNSGMHYEGKYVIYNGKEALLFNVGFSEFYAYNNGMQVVLEEKSNIPLPPPPPPLP